MGPAARLAAQRAAPASMGGAVAATVLVVPAAGLANAASTVAEATARGKERVSPVRFGVIGVLCQVGQAPGKEPLRGREGSGRPALACGRQWPQRALAGASAGP